ncbi:MAG: WecB/TagA/CpsF family glycosyltransferase [Acetobacteraceae bacterium]
MGERSQPRRRIFGLNITEGESGDVARHVVRVRPTRVELMVTPNIDHIVHLRSNAAFARAYRRAAIVVCDGFPVRYYAALCGIPVQRVTGVDILERLMSGPLYGHRLFFVVDSEATASAIRSWARQRGAVVKTAVPPVMFESDENLCRGLVRQINDHDTSILIMGIGAPKSEIWVDTRRNSLPPCWALCVGQATRIACGLTMRAPILVRRLNCEWLWRVCQEPRRLWWRYLRGFTLFPLAIIEDQLNHWLSRLAWRQADAPPERVAPVHRASRLAKTTSGSLQVDALPTPAEGMPGAGSMDQQARGS